MSSGRTWWQGFALLFCAARCGWAAADVEAILNDYVQHLGKATYSALESLDERQSDGAPVHVRTELKLRNDRERMRVIAGPEAYQGLVSSNDGSRQVIYVPPEGRLYLYSTRAADATQRKQREIQKMRERYRAEWIADEKVADRPCHHLRLTARGDGAPTVDVWLDTAESVALRQETRLRNQVIRRSVFDRVNFQAVPPDSDFKFVPPKGTAVVKAGKGDSGTGLKREAFRMATPDEVRRKAGLRAMVPGYLPSGYALDGFFLPPPTPGAVFHRRLMVKYSSGPSILILNMGGLAPGKKGSRGDSPPAEVKPGILLWTRHSVRLLLIGPRGLEADELQHCAKSVDWHDAGGRGRRSTDVAAGSSAGAEPITTDLAGESDQPTAVCVPVF